MTPGGQGRARGPGVRVAVLPPAYMILGVVETAVRDDRDPMDVTRVHFEVGERLGLPDAGLAASLRCPARTAGRRWRGPRCATTCTPCTRQLTAKVLRSTSPGDPSRRIAVGRTGQRGRAGGARRSRRSAPTRRPTSPGSRSALRVVRTPVASGLPLAWTRHELRGRRTWPTWAWPSWPAVRRIGEVTARVEVVEAPRADRSARSRPERLLRRAGRRGAGRGGRARDEPSPRGRRRSAARRSRSRSRRRSTSPARSRPSAAGRTPPRGRRTPRSCAGCARPARWSSARRTMPEFGQWPFTESVARGITRNPWDPRAHPRRLQRRHRGRGGRRAWSRSAIGGDGGGSIRIPGRLLRALRPQARSAAGSPPRRTPHLWWALGTTGPLTRTVLDSALVYDVIRGNVEGDLFRAERAGDLLRRGGRGASPAGCGSAGRRSRRSAACGPTRPRAGRRGDRAAARRPRPRRARGGPGATPTRRTAFVPQFFAGVRSRGRAGGALRAGSSGAPARPAASAPG